MVTVAHIPGPTATSRLIERFEREFPELAPHTIVLDPERPEPLHQQLHDRMPQIEAVLKPQLGHTNYYKKLSAMEQAVKPGIPHFFGVRISNPDRVFSVINPNPAPSSWADRVAPQNPPSERAWAVPDLTPIRRLGQAYSHYTFHHETGHAIWHQLNPFQQQERPTAGQDSGIFANAWEQRQETYSDMRGALSLLRDRPADEAIETVTRLTHLRALCAVHHGDHDHLTIRGFKAVLGAAAGAHDTLAEWQQPGWAGATALNEDLQNHSIGYDDMAALKAMQKLLTPGDTHEPERALRKLAETGAQTDQPAVYELARDYVEAVAALVPAERYDESSLLQARLALRRNPMAAEWDQLHPRIETLALHARQAMVASNDAAPAPQGADKQRPVPTLGRTGP